MMLHENGWPTVMVEVMGQLMRDGKSGKQGSTDLCSQAGIHTRNVFHIHLTEDVGEELHAMVVIDGHEYNITCVSMGNPHCAVFAPTVDKLDLTAIGPMFEFNPLFPQRVNVEFIEVEDEKTLRVRVWERGSGETMACGTGACAAVVAATLNGKCKKGEKIRVILKGGDLEVQYTDERVLMTGGAETVFNGAVEV